MDMIEACPACLNKGFEKLIDYGIVPRSGVFLTELSQSYETRSLAFDFCSNCGLIIQRTTKDVFDYTSINRRTSHRLPHYAAQVIESLNNNGVQKNDLIIEVGANDGTFLDFLTKEQYDRCIGIEPSLYLADICRAKGLIIENIHLNQNAAKEIIEKYGPAKAVICRHTLEHVPDPLDLVLAMRKILDAHGIFIVEVPSSYGIIWEGRGYELWDEHITMFMPKNLVMLLQRAGFSVDTVLVDSFCGSKNMLLWAKNESHQQNITLTDDINNNIKACRQFAASWRDFSGRLIEELANLPRPVGCFGASHPQSNFVNFTGIGRKLDFFMDDDISKIGKYLPVPNSVPVLSLEQVLKDCSSGTLIRSAFGYDKWMDRVLSDLRVRGIKELQPVFGISSNNYEKRRSV